MVTVDTSTVGTSADYATLALWQTGERTNLMTADKIARAAVKDELHTAAFPFSGTWGTDATRYAWIDAENAAARHDGTAGTGARLITDNNIPVIIQTNEHLHVTWLELADTTPNNSRPCIRINSASGAHLHMGQLIVHEQGMGFYIQTGADNCTIDLLDTLIYNNNRRGIRLDGTGHTVRIYNTTAWNTGRQGATHAALYVDSPSTTTVDLRNTLLHTDAAADAILLNGAGDPWDAGCDQNILSDASGTAEGLSGDMIESATFQAGTGGSGTRVMFESLTASSEDLTILSDAGNSAIDYGNNLTAETFPDNIFIEDDLFGVTREATGAWDAGASEFLVLGSEFTAPLPIQSAAGIVGIADVFSVSGGVLGINLSQHTYFSSELLFVDTVRSMGSGSVANRGWLSQLVPHSTWDTLDPLTLDSDGWPLSLAAGTAAGCLMRRSIGDHYPSGDYVALYDGEGTLEWKFDAGAVSEQTAGREVVAVTPSDAGVWMRIIATTPGDPIRNIRFFPKDLEATHVSDPFHSVLMNRWAQFGPFRFMDLQRTNDSLQTDWADRPLTTDHRQSDPALGVAIEHLIDLCNRTNTDAWFCIPHLATDAYVTSLAELIFANLDTGLRVFVEYSNETWNGIFDQEDDIATIGYDLGYGENPVGAPGSGNRTHAGWRYQAQRAVEIGIIFEGVFGGLSRLVRVMGTQSANQGLTDIQLAWPIDGTEFGPLVSTKLDALAVAPYFGSQLANGQANADFLLTQTVPQSLQLCLDEINDSVKTQIISQKAAADAAGLDLVAYEGGQHLVGNPAGVRDGTPGLTEHLLAINGDAGMEDVYRQYLAVWKDNGGELFVHFDSTDEWSKFGSWGALQYFDDSEDPQTKYSALLEWSVSQTWFIAPVPTQAASGLAKRTGASALTVPGPTTTATGIIVPAGVLSAPLPTTTATGTVTFILGDLVVKVLFDGIGQAGQRKSNRPEEYVRLTHVQPDAGQPIKRYDLDIDEPGHHPGEVLPILENPFTGEQETPPTWIPIPPGDAGNPFAEKEHVFELEGHQQRIWFSERHAVVNRFRTVLGSPYNFDLEWLSESGPFGQGLSIGGSERWAEYEGTASVSWHNPTAGGARPLPFDNNPLPSKELVVPPSVRLYGRVTKEFIEGAVIPTEWLDNEGEPDGVHNTDPTHVALFWRQRQYERVTPFFLGNPFLTRITKLFYQPRSYQASDYEEPFLEFVETIHPTKFVSLVDNILGVMDGLGFDQGWYADLQNDTALRNLEDVFAGVTFDRTEIQTWGFNRGFTFYTGPDLDAAGGPLFNSGFGVLVQSRSSDGFAIAVGCALAVDRGEANLTDLQLTHAESAARVQGVSVPHHSHPGGSFFFSAAKDVQSRKAGWIGYHIYLYTGPLDQVFATMSNLGTEMLKVPDPAAMLPSVVREGTDLTDSRAVVEPPLQQVRLARAKTFSSRLR